ncbi:MAG TPA: CHAT domain-containing tetratricopeptide repeat protein, partial [Cyclobacteriaceae bacterium]
KQKDFEKALFYELKNIDFANSMLKDPFLREAAYEGLAITYGDLGQYDKARSYYQKAIAFNQEVNKGAKNALLGYYYEKLGELDENNNSFSSAIVNHKKAVQIFSSLQNSKNPNYIKSLLRLGKLYASSDSAKSLMSFRSALLLINQGGLTKSGSAVELNSAIADHFAEVHQMDSALVYYQHALNAGSLKFSDQDFNHNPEKEDITLKDYAFEVLLKKASLLAKQFRSSHKVNYAESAIRSYMLAETLLSESRMDLDTDGSKWNFFDSNFELYENAISFLFEVNTFRPADSLVNQAFLYMESSKSKTLSDALNQAEFAAPLMGSDSLIQSLNGQKKRLHFLNDQLKKSTDKRIIEETGTAMIAADRSIQRIEEQLNTKYPSYLKTKYKSKTHSIKALQDYAQEKKATIVEYFSGTTTLFSIAISTESVEFKRLGSIGAVEEEIRAILQRLSSTENDYSKDAVMEFVKNSSSLYQLILQPVEKQIKSNDHLIIIPDGIVGQVPFEVLITSTKPKSNSNYQTLDYLVKTHFLSYSFSSSYLLNEKNDQPKEAKLLAFGFTGGESVRSPSINKENVELVGSEKEIEGLAKKFPTGEFFFGSEVTEKRFKEKAPLFDILHLAVHGQGDTEQNYSASLYFRDSLTSGNEDGRLNWYELFDMHLKAQLAVISSCESGIGKVYRGEGMLSMANAFAFAGCRNVVMGLWKVNDQVSVMLMDSFYEKIREGKRVDDALTFAKRKYLEQGDELSSNPKMWASLVAYGNQQVVERNKFMIWYFVFALIVFAAGLLFFRRKMALKK